MFLLQCKNASESKAKQYQEVGIFKRLVLCYLIRLNQTPLHIPLTGTKY
jgi:hypothetical protein